MSFVRDSDRFSRGVGAIAARDGGNRKRYIRRAQRQAALNARDRQLADYTYGPGGGIRAPMGAIDRGESPGDTPGPQGGGTPPPSGPFVNTIGRPIVAQPTSSTQNGGMVSGGVVVDPGPRVPIRDPMLPISTRTGLTSLLQIPSPLPQGGRPAPTSSPLSETRGGITVFQPSGSGSGSSSSGGRGDAGVVLDTPPGLDLEIVDPVLTDPPPAPARPQLNLKTAAIVGGIGLAAYLLLRKKGS